MSNGNNWTRYEETMGTRHIPRQLILWYLNKEDMSDAQNDGRKMRLFTCLKGGWDRPEDLSLCAVSPLSFAVQRVRIYQLKGEVLVRECCILSAKFCMAPWIQNIF
jgi:hypothetical protein